MLLLLVVVVAMAGGCADGDNVRGRAGGAPRASGFRHLFTRRYEFFENSFMGFSIASKTSMAAPDSPPPPHPPDCRPRAPSGRGQRGPGGGP